MKISLSIKKNTRGSALVIVMVLGTLMLLSVSGYLTIVNHQAFLSARSQAWNTSIAVVEAGIEEAMEHLNANPASLATQGWGYDGTRYVLDYDMGDGSGYSVSIDMTDPENPEVVSKAFSTLDGGPITPVFATVGAPNERVTLTRAVRVRATRGSMYIKGMVAKISVDMNGNDVMTDSYDSSTETKSTDHRYDPGKAGDNGDVYVNSSILNAINVGNANIYGKVATGPRGTVAVGPTGGVGEKSWVATHPGQIQPEWHSDDMNFTFPETPLPFTTGIAPIPEDVVTVSNYVTEVPQTGTPGPGVPGVATNVAYTYVTAYPGNIFGLITNYVWHNTLVAPSPSTVYNGIITTNLVPMNSDDWPGSSVGEIRTNIFWQTSSGYPSDARFVLTNFVLKSDSSLPSPVPAGPISTNTQVVKSKSPPEDGTYLGTPEKTIGWWYYNLIIGYTWQVVEYSWPVREYVWQEAHYLFQTVEYGIPNFTYAWNSYVTNYVFLTNHYDNVIRSGRHVINTLSGKTYVMGDAELVVFSDIRMSGSDTLVIGPNGKLHAYVDGRNTAISGNGIINETGLAENCIIEFTLNVRSISLGGNGEFVGVIVAPYSNLDLDGGGSAVTDFCGAVIGNTITLRGHFKFHYDEALGRLPRNSRYLVNIWDEIRPDTAFGTAPTSTAPVSTTAL